MDAEAVLLVDDDEAEVVEVDFFFDEGVGADGEVDFAAGDAVAGFALGAGVERAGEEGDAVGAVGAGGPGFAEELAGGEKVLGGEDFGGGHEGDLEAVFDSDERGLEGDDGFAGAYVALEETAHGLGAAHVGDDFAEDALLGRGGLEGEDLFEGFADLGAGGEGGAVAVAEAATFELEAELEVEELFEDEAAVGGGAGGLEVGEGGAGGGEVDVLEGVEAGGEVEALEEGGGEGFGGLGRAEIGSLRG